MISAREALAEQLIEVESEVERRESDKLQACPQRRTKRGTR